MGGQEPPTSSPSIILTRGLDGYLEYPHAAKALYIYKHPGFEPRPYGSAVSINIHCTGWSAHHIFDHQ
ncbi:hypothetical protein TNCV_1538351 [Trichonephila clavipes]|nr:hypothetical protein TNCV_1538351 [Trichonephila clavipes]